MVAIKIAEQISDTERIVLTVGPGNIIVYVHQFLKNGKWKTCLDCGKKLPSGRATPGSVRKIDHIRDYCPKYRSTK